MRLIRLRYPMFLYFFAIRPPAVLLSAIIFLLPVLSSGQFRPGNAAGQTNPEPVIPGDFADPSVIRVGATYYAAGTSSEWAPWFPLFKSGDLANWLPAGYAFRTKPSWALSSFWAPELFFRNGKYYLYYVARRATDSISCIGLATAENPEKGFTDHGVILSFGREAIDPFLIEDSSGLFISWKAYGLDDRPIELLGARMSDDGMRITGKPFSLLKDDQRRGLEGQCIIRQGRYFYLFYSAGACCGINCSYTVHVARSEKLEGPYTENIENPVIGNGSGWKCPGHGTLVKTANEQWYYLFHAYNQSDSTFTGRQAMLGQLDWAEGWPSVRIVSPDRKKRNGHHDIVDDFSGDRLSDHWQWDFRHAHPQTALDKRRLCLSGEITGDNASGTALTVRPYHGDYEMQVTVANRNAALKGLTVYGDASQSVGIGIRDDTLELWQVKDNRRTVLKTTTVTAHPVTLSIKIQKGFVMHFYWKNRTTPWTQLGSVPDAGYLPPWDRSPRPGLLHQGDKNVPACFSDFHLVYSR